MTKERKLEVTEHDLQSFLNGQINYCNPLNLHMNICEAVMDTTNPRIMRKYHIQVTTSAIPHQLSDFVFCEVDIPAESLFTKIDHLNRVLKLNRDAYRINYGW